MFKLYFHTFKEILTHPKNVVDSFIHTKESRFQHPMLFMFLGLIVVILLNSLLVDYSADLPEVAQEIENEQLQELSEWIFISNIRLSTQFLPLMMVVLLVPMLSLSGLFFFRNELEGFYSNLIINSYLAGAAIPFLLLMIPVLNFINIPLTEPAMSTTIPGFLVAGAGILVYKNYFSISELFGWIRILSSFITGYLLFVFLKGFAAGITGYMIFAIRRIQELA